MGKWENGKSRKKAGKVGRTFVFSGAFVSSKWFGKFSLLLEIIRIYGTHNYNMLKFIELENMKNLSISHSTDENQKQKKMNEHFVFIVNYPFAILPTTAVQTLN